MNKQELTEFISDMFNVNECPEMILRQIHKYVTERRYDYLEIARALSYFVDIQGNTLQIKYGIGIVPVVMEQSRRYFKEQEEQRKQQIKAAEQAKKDNQPKKEIYIKVNDKKTLKKPRIDISKL